MYLQNEVNYKITLDYCAFETYAILTQKERLKKNSHVKQEPEVAYAILHFGWLRISTIFPQTCSHLTLSGPTNGFICLHHPTHSWFFLLKNILGQRELPKNAMLKNKNNVMSIFRFIRNYLYIKIKTMKISRAFKNVPPTVSKFLAMPFRLNVLTT